MEMKLTRKLKEKATRLKNEILAISLAFKDKRTPLMAKIMIGIIVGYAISPIDLIPDFIPVIGYLDDLIILPALMVITVKMIPAEVLEDCRKQVKEKYQFSKKAGWIAAGVVVLIWALIIVAFIV
jgi:uncharacterized membrane protein YkvA (DUF1232 family)